MKNFYQVKIFNSPFKVNSYTICGFANARLLAEDIRVLTGARTVVIIKLDKEVRK